MLACSKSTKAPAQPFTRVTLFCFGIHPNRSTRGILMSLIYSRRANQPSFTHLFNDYLGEIKPFAKRIDKRYLTIPLVVLKTIEWSIYRWYKTPIRRFYGVKGNEHGVVVTCALSVVSGKIQNQMMIILT